MNLEDCLLGLYEKALPFSWDWEKKLGMIKEFGFDFMEFSIDPHHINRLDWAENEILLLRDISFKLGIPLHTMALSANREYPIGSENDSVRGEGKSLLKKAIRLAQKLGIRIIQVAAYDVYGEEGNEETDRLFIDSLREVERSASLAGVMLALETMDTLYAGSVYDCKRIIEQINSPWVQIYADTGNIASNGYIFAKDIKTGADNIIAIHLKDSKKGVVRGINYGTGLVDFHEDLNGLKDIDFHGFFVAEMWWKEEPGYLDQIQFAHDFLRKEIKTADDSVPKGR